MNNTLMYGFMEAMRFAKSRPFMCGMMISEIKTSILVSGAAAISKAARPSLAS